MIQAGEPAGSVDTNLRSPLQIGIWRDSGLHVKCDGLRGRFLPINASSVYTEWQEALMTAITPDSSVGATCPCCGVGCQMNAQIKDERIYRVAAPFESAPNYGDLRVKGRFGLDFDNAGTGAGDNDRFASKCLGQLLSP